MINTCMTHTCTICENSFKPTAGSSGLYCSLTCSNLDRPRKNALKYDLDPKRCPECDEAIPYHKRFSNTFCSHSCAATHNNRDVRRVSNYSPRVTGICKCCNEQYEYLPSDRKYAIGQFCSATCKHHYARTDTKRRMSEGKVAKRGTLKKYLLEDRGHQCERCEETEWMGEAIPLELDHINGLANDNMPTNLRLLCPNCHAQQPTSKGGNLGRGRGSLGLTLG
jgi:hypothetical protein